MLRPDTQRLWEVLQSCPALRGFVLVGGTALTMHLGHRISEVLDFMWPASRLPEGRVAGLRRWLDQRHIPLAANDSAAAIDAFSESGLSLLDFLRNYTAGGTVKLTLAAPEREVRHFLGAATETALRVADAEDIFRLKCLACADRSKSRHWLDLYVMLQPGIAQPIEILRTFASAGVPAQFDIAMMRLCQASPNADDEGYETLLDHPPSLEQMRDHFTALRDQIGVLADRVFHAPQWARVGAAERRAAPTGWRNSGRVSPPSHRRA